jgi:hypothetical protein
VGAEENVLGLQIRVDDRTLPRKMVPSEFGGQSSGFRVQGRGKKKILRLQVCVHDPTQPWKRMG